MIIRRLPVHTMSRVLHHIVALGLAILFVLPLGWVISASLRQPGLPPPQSIEWIPTSPAWSNYQRIFQIVPLDRFTLNSLVVVALAVPLTLVTASLAGFSMAQLHERTRGRLIVFSILLLMVPVTALWLTRFVLFKSLMLINTHLALIAPSIMGSSPTYVLLFYWTFRRIPHETFESAHIDGANMLRIWASIALPLAVPTIIAVSILSSVDYWSDFINPLLYLKSQNLYTLAVGLQMLQQLDTTNWPLLMAAAMVMTAPVILVFLVAQRYILQEGRLGGIHGR